MIKNFILAFLAPLLLVSVPILLMPEETPIGKSAETLIIITPNSAQIKYEFEHAFRIFYKQKTGKEICIDWRAPGGTSDIVRYVDNSYIAAFRRYAEQHGMEWTEKSASEFKDRKLKHGESKLRDMFLDSNVGIGIDLFFGGGTFDMARFADMGYGIDAKVEERHPEYFENDEIPIEFAGEKIRDAAGRYYGCCLSSFGIAYNPERLKELGLQPPKSWVDLTDPRYMNQLVIADPTKSGSVNKCYEMILQQAMQELGPEKGWAEGFRRIKLFTANARTITDSAGKVVRDISSGDAAAGMCIDFYGLSEADWAMQTSGREKLVYVMPAGGSSVSADPIQLLRGAPHRENAEMFIDFLLSPEGSAIWMLKPGVPGGPVKSALLRPSVRRSLPNQLDRDKMSYPDYRPYETAGKFVYRSDWTGNYYSLLRVFVKCIALDPCDELHRAWAAIIANGGPDKNPDAMEELLKLPVTFETADAAANGLYGSAGEVAALRREWTEAAWQSYHKIAEDLGK